MNISSFRVIDLSHTLNDQVPTWSGACGFHAKIVSQHSEGCQVWEYQTLGGLGTHMDAPVHFIPGAKDISHLDISHFLAPLCVVDLSHIGNPDGKITLRDLETYEKRHRKIPEGSVVVGHTGWSRYWNQPGKYRNANEHGHMHFPTFAPEVVPFLLEREIVGIGIDTLSPDPEQSDFPIHRQLLGAGKYILENLTHLDLVPKKGAFLCVAPLKIEGASEAPVRALAFIAP